MNYDDDDDPIVRTLNDLLNRVGEGRPAKDAGHHAHAVYVLNQLDLLMMGSTLVMPDDGDMSARLRRTISIAHAGGLVMAVEAVAIALLSIDEALRERGAAEPVKWDMP